MTILFCVGIASSFSSAEKLEEREAASEKVILLPKQGG